MRLKFLLPALLFINFVVSQNYHDTQGKLEISSNGQATYTLPIALPPSIQSVGPTINLNYASSQMGGIAGQGWSINSISSISRIATRKDIDGFIDGVDFDANDKLALDGQRLLLVSGTYFSVGSVYKTEVLSNTKIELLGTSTAMYFVVTYPDGSRSWYGNYGGTNGNDLTSFYIVRFEDVKGNFITYHYNRPFSKSLCINIIRFSGNVNGVPTPQNYIQFNYIAAKRNESGYINGLKYEKVEILKDVSVYTNGLLFRKYLIDHLLDNQLGYERISSIKEVLSTGEEANPVIFNYDTTTSTNTDSETVTSYNNNLNFNNIELSGDFDGDGRLDFVTEDKLYRNLFQGSSGQTPISLPFTINKKSDFIATTMTGNKMNQYQSLVKTVKSSNYTNFMIYDKNPDTSPYSPGFVLNYMKSINIDNYFLTPTGLPPSDAETVFNGNVGDGYNNQCTELIAQNNIKNNAEYLEGDFNGDGISEILIVNSKNEKNWISNTIIGTIGINTCVIKRTNEGYQTFLLDLNSNSSTTLGTQGFVDLNTTEFTHKNKKIIMDFNSDGKSDIIIINDDRTYKVFTINQLLEAPWHQLEVIGQGIIDKYSKTKQMLFGDYNGDGKTDIMLPDTEGGSGHTLWHIYYSNPKPIGGEFFFKESHNIVEYRPDTGIPGSPGADYETQVHYSRYYAMDTNGDGKSDIVRIWMRHYKVTGPFEWNNHNTEWKITSYVNNIGNTLITGNKFQLDYVTPCQTVSSAIGSIENCNHDSDSPGLIVPVVSNFKHGGIKQDIVIVHNHYERVFYIKFKKDVAQDIRISKVTSSGGNIVDEIFYKTMEPETTFNNGLGALNEFYSSTNSVEYPNVELNKLPAYYLVKELKNTSNGLVKTQDFKYNGLVVNLHGLGTIGFNKTARSAWYTLSNAKRLWNVSENRYDWRGANYRSYSQLLNDGNLFSFVLSGDPSGITASTINQFSQSTTNGMYKIQLDSQTTKDFFTNVSNQITYEYVAEYLLPLTITSKNYITSPSSPTETKIVTNDYYPTSLGLDYYIGRIKKTSITVNAYGNTQTSEEKFTYTNNKLTKTEKRGNTTENIYITEEFEYDFNNNIKKKTLSVPGAIPSVAPRVTEYTYDASKRFVKTVKDIEGLISENSIFHPLYGLVMESTTPFGQVTKSEYDSWGKRTKVIDYLNKNITYTYTKSGNNYTTTEVSQDGSSSVIIADALGRTIKKGKKNFDGSWSYVSSEYDVFGRKFRESEPYFGTTPSLWSTSEFDDYSRVIKSIAPTGLETTITYTGLTVTGTNGIKTTTSTKNANGHVVLASDNGGVINYTYYADGSLKTSNFDGTELYMVYDAYGRKTKLSDPSAGVYIYNYNAYGEILEETTPKGKTKYLYDNFGKITQKKVEGLTLSDYTNITTNYVYNSTTKLLTSMNVINPNDGNSSYTYEYTTGDNRLKKTIETTPYASFSKELTFDEFGRDLTVLYQGTDLVSGRSTSKKVRNGYQNGALNQIFDDATSQVLWQATNVNARGQLTNGFFGNGVVVANTYDQYGFPTQIKHDFDTFDDGVTTVGPGGAIGSTIINILTLNTNFNTQRGNLTSRTTSLFNLTENFQYDSLDRLIEWGSEPELLFNLLFAIGFEGFTATPGATMSSAAGKMKITTSVSNAGAKKLILPNAIVGTKLTISAFINKATTNKVRVSIVEQDPTSGLTVENELGLANEGTFQAEYEVSKYKDVYLKFAKAPTSTDVGTSTQFLVDNIVINRLRKYQQTYDNKGRIEQSPLGTYSYDDTKKYQNSKVELTLAGITYYNQHPLQEVSYNAFKSPIRIFEENHDKINFTYNTFQSRSSMFYGGLQEDKLLRSKRKHYAADGSIEIKTSGGTIEFITYIGGDAYSAPVIYKTNGSVAQEYLYLHRDYLGSIVAISNQTGAVVEKRHFDAWGSIAKVTDGSGNELAGLTLLDRGYTGHEHLQSVGLIHMNGRLYEAKVHRFLMPDNFIQDPSNTQNYNRYGYVLNNPMRYTDPSGEELISFGLALGIGAFIAATSYTIQAGYTYGFQASGWGFLKAVVIGTASAAATYGIGTYAKTIETLSTRIVFQAFAHGTTQATVAGIQGGDPLVGFASGALSSAASSLFSGGSMANGGDWKGLGGSWGRSGFGIMAFGTIGGGAGAALTKGNFWQGAVTGLVVSGLNHLAHMQENKYVKGAKEYVATVVSESSDNALEAEGIGSVIINRANHKGIEIEAGFIDKIGGESEFQGIRDNANDYNNIMKMSLKDIGNTTSKQDYYLRIKGALTALFKSAAGTPLITKGFFWNASYQQYEKKQGFNFNQLNNGTFVKDTVLGATTFFRYANSNKNWP